jgi:hypothetical protein
VTLSTAEHQWVQRETKAARNRAARYTLAQQRGRELARLRRENAHLKAQLAAVRAVFVGTTHVSISPEDWAALRHALELA